MKYIVLVSLSQDIGGAQKRYISLFNEINKRKADYTLVINRSLYDLALAASLFNSHTNIRILEIDRLKESNTDTAAPSEKKIRSKKKDTWPRRFYNWTIDLWHLIKYASALKKVFKANPPEYVYGIWTGGMITWPLKYLFKFRFTYAYMDSGFSSIYPHLKYLLKNERLPLIKSDCIDFLSDDLRKEVNNKIRIPLKTVQTVSPCSFKNYDNLAPKHPKNNWIVFASRLTAIKDPLLLLKSIKLAKSRCAKISTYTIWILGDGEMYDELLEYKLQNDLSLVELPGHVHDPERYLERSKIFVSVQKNNNYPSQSLLEAMACSNCVIATDVGETRRLINEHNGILLDGDPEKVADALCYLAENEAEAQKMGENARRKVTEEHNVSRYLDYFYSLETMQTC